MPGKFLRPALYFSAFLFALHVNLPAYGQEEEQEIKQIISRLQEEDPQESNMPDEDTLTELSSQLLFYKSHKINLNNTTPEQLKELTFLSHNQINNLFIHIANHGKLLDLLELQSIPGFDKGTISTLIPFVTLTQESAYRSLQFSTLLKKGSHELTSRFAQILEKQKGYTDLPGSRYIGSPQKLLIKYRYRLDNLVNASLLMKKDAGEPFLKGINKTGFDFTSASLTIKKAGPFNKVVLGDYSLQFGQGLTLWSGFSFGKGADVAGVAKKYSGLHSYTSGSEYSFFRGLSSEIKILKTIDLTSFISLRNLDASLTEIGNGESTLSAIGNTGLHRTATEIAGKGKLRQLFYGCAANYQSHSIHVGAVVSKSHYNHSFVTGEAMYRNYNFHGNSLMNGGLHYNLTLRNAYLFGELSKSFPGGMAFLNGIMSSLGSGISAVVLYRNYAKDHYNYHAQAIAEAEVKNEEGIYAGINITITSKWLFSTSINTYNFPWLRYRIDASSSGSEIMAQLNYVPSKSFKALIRLKTKVNAQNTTDNLPFYSLAPINQQNIRIGIDWEPNKQFNFQHRAELVLYQHGSLSPEPGYLVYTDLAYHPRASVFSGNMRLAGFYTASYNSRLYAYEDDVLSASTSGLYYGRGLRSYLNLKYRLSRQMNCWLKYSISLYPQQEKTGSGLDEINGHKKSELKAQLHYRF